MNALSSLTAAGAGAPIDRPRVTPLGLSASKIWVSEADCACASEAHPSIARPASRAVYRAVPWVISVIERMVELPGFGGASMAGRRSHELSSIDDRILVCGSARLRLPNPEPGEVIRDSRIDRQGPRH